MPLETTIGQLLINQALPEDMRSYDRVLNKGGVAELFTALAEKHPDKYRQVAKDLSDIGRDAATETGGYSFGLRHLRTPVSAKLTLEGVRKKIREIRGDKNLPSDAKNTAIIQTLLSSAKPLQQAALEDAKATGNPLAGQITSGARGNPVNLNSLIGADLLYVDHRERPIPLPVLRSYAQGLRPAEYYAAAFGARKGLYDLKIGTADAGYLGKQLTQAAHRLLVSADDDPEHDDTIVRGLPAATDDPEVAGSLLARPVGKYPRNTVLTPRLLKELRADGHDEILVRSPMVGGPADGGVYSRDVGVREKGRLAPLGDFVGISAAQALCLAAGTMVRMADGSSRAIENVEPGDEVLGCNTAGLLRPVRVLARFDNGLRPCVEAVFRDGTGRARRENLLRICATSDHNILSEIVIRSGNRHPRYFSSLAVRPLGTQVQPHDAFCASLSTGFDDTGLVAEPRACLLGVLVGDGCYTGGVASNGVSLSCHDPQQIADLERIYAAAGIVFRPQTQPGEYRIVDTAATTLKVAEDGTRYRNQVSRWLKELGIWGQRSHEKQLPAIVHSWDNASIGALLGGLIATDGYIVSATVSIGFCSSSLQLIRQIKTLLRLRFGASSSSIAKAVKKKKDGSDYRPVYRIIVGRRTDVVRLAACLLIPGRKALKLRRLLQKKPQMGVPRVAGRCRLVARQPVGLRPTHDIYVAHPDHLFVLENGLIVSNSEPLAQSVISSKHSGGVAGASAGAIGGFKLIDAMAQAPKVFPGGAAHAQLDGRVDNVREAPQGGWYISVNGQEHYAGSHATPIVKPGDTIEAGDLLTQGNANPAELVKHKGIGEGRREFANRLTRILKDSGINAHRRNVELVARGLINHVRLTDEVGDWVPDDVIPYQALERQWSPRAGTQLSTPQAMVNRYLEQPVLHYSIGTRITPSVVKSLQKYGVNAIHAHTQPPPFEPEMIRGMANVAEDPDWATRLLGSYQSSSLLDAVHRGRSSNTAGTSYVPALMEGANFGIKGLTKGFKP